MTVQNAASGRAHPRVASALAMPAVAGSSLRDLLGEVEVALTTATIEQTIELTLVVPVDHRELSCIQDGKVATHEVFGPPCGRHLYCLAHADWLTRFLLEYVALVSGRKTWECASHLKVFRSDCSKWRIVPIARSSASPAGGGRP